MNKQNFNTFFHSAVERFKNEKEDKRQKHKKKKIKKDDTTIVPGSYSTKEKGMFNSNKDAPSSSTFKSQG